MYKIEKMEVVKRPRARTLTALIGELKVGEGFYVPIARHKSAASEASRLGKIAGWKIGVYKVDDERVQVVRREDPK